MRTMSHQIRNIYQEGEGFFILKIKITQVKSMIIKIKIQKYPYSSLMAISSKQKKELINLKIHQLRLSSLRNKKSKMKKRINTAAETMGHHQMYQL